MIKRVILYFLCLNLSSSIIAQKHDYTWVTSSGIFDTISDPNRCFGGGIIHFSKDGITKQLDHIDHRYSGQNTSMSNEEGELAYSSNGCNVLNDEFEIIRNGDTINSDFVNNTGCFVSSMSSTVYYSMLSLPHPFAPNRYFQVYFDMDVANSLPSLIYGNNMLINEILIDVENPELSRILRKREVILTDTLSFSSLAAVKDASGTGWFITARRMVEPYYFKVHFYDLDSFSVTTQTIGKQEILTDNGNSHFTPDGEHYIITSDQEQVQIFDFDRNTGELSNPVYANVPNEFNGAFLASATSSNSRFLYTWTLTEMYQFDLLATDVEASVILIDTFDGFADPFPSSFFMGQLAPDCRIYMTAITSTHYYHVIKYPNRKGKACEFKQHDFRLPAYHYSTVPAYPNYRLDSAPVCDSTLLVNTRAMPYRIDADILIYPQPASVSVTLHLDGVSLKPTHIELYDINGQLVKKERWLADGEEMAMDISDLVPGIYLTRFVHRFAVIGERKIIVN